MGTTPSATLDRFVHSYLFLRRAIGIIGMALPLVLVLGVAAESGDVLSSISGYYYSGLRDVFVGCMCAVGVFLIFYHGPRRIDDISSGIAGGAALGVALFPTRPSAPFTEVDRIVGFVHIGCAAIFFLTLAASCIFLFTRREQENADGGDRKGVRNVVYVTCGVIILVCIAFMVLFGLLLEAQTRSLHPALWLESAAIFAFGVSWLIKGDTLLRDRPPAEKRALPAEALASL